MEKTNAMNYAISMFYMLNRFNTWGRYCIHKKKCKSFCCCDTYCALPRPFVAKAKMGLVSAPDIIHTHAIQENKPIRYITENMDLQKPKDLSTREEFMKQNEKGNSPLMSESIPSAFMDLKKDHTLKQNKNATEIKNHHDSNHSGLLHYRKWWERVNVEISVNGTLVTGVPIFIEENTLRVINNSSSYFIPLEKVDYIRTSDGLDSCVLSDVKETGHIVFKTPNN